MSNTPYATMAMISVEPKYEQYQAKIGHMTGSTFNHVDTLYAATKQGAIDVANKHYDDLTIAVGEGS